MERRLRLSKNYVSDERNRAAGELEGARPASNSIRNRQKVIESQRLSMTFSFVGEPLALPVGTKALAMDKKKTPR